MLRTTWDSQDLRTAGHISDTKYIKYHLCCLEQPGTVESCGQLIILCKYPSVGLGWVGGGGGGRPVLLRTTRDSQDLRTADHSS